MQVINSTKIVYVDVDDTLIFSASEKPNLPCSYPVQIGGCTWVIYTPHIEMIKDFKARGHTVVVWSQGGAEWTEMVVKVAGVEGWVDLVISKPDWYIDDKPAFEWLDDNRRRYLINKEQKLVTEK